MWAYPLNQFLGLYCDNDDPNATMRGYTADDSSIGLVASTKETPKTFFRSIASINKVLRFMKIDLLLKQKQRRQGSNTET